MNNNRTYPNSGALFSKRNKGSERAADMDGDITVEAEVLDYILQCVDRREPVKIGLAAWRRSSNNAGAWLSLKAEIPYSVRKGQADGGRSQRREPDRGRDMFEGNQGRDDYRNERPRQDYNPRHDTQIGGSQRDYRRPAGDNYTKGPEDDDFPPRGGRGGLDRL